MVPAPVIKAKHDREHERTGNRYQGCHETFKNLFTNSIGGISTTERRGRHHLEWTHLRTDHDVVKWQNSHLFA